MRMSSMLVLLNLLFLGACQTAINASKVTPVEDFCSDITKSQVSDTIDYALLSLENSEKIEKFFEAIRDTAALHKWNPQMALTNVSEFYLGGGSTHSSPQQLATVTFSYDNLGLAFTFSCVNNEAKISSYGNGECFQLAHITIDSITSEKLIGDVLVGTTTFSQILEQSKGFLYSTDVHVKQSWKRIYSTGKGAQWKLIINQFQFFTPFYPNFNFETDSSDNYINHWQDDHFGNEKFVQLIIFKPD